MLLTLTNNNNNKKKVSCTCILYLFNDMLVVSQALLGMFFVFLLLFFCYLKKPALPVFNFLLFAYFYMHGHGAGRHIK